MPGFSRSFSFVDRIECSFISICLCRASMSMSSLSHSVDASYISIDNYNPVNHISMGRTLPTWRDRIESRMEHWSIFRRALRLDERSDFDRLVKSVRMRSSACSMVPAVDEIEPALLAMLVGLESRLSKLEKELHNNG